MKNIEYRIQETGIHKRYSSVYYTLSFVSCFASLPFVTKVRRLLGNPKETQMVLIMAFLIGFPLFLGAQDLGTLRKKYPMASKDSLVAKELFVSLEQSAKRDALTLAYKGAIYTIRAKFTKPIKKKKSLVREGIALLEQALENDGDNIEIRCLRLSVQEHLPKFIKYHGHIGEDKEFILAHFAEITSKDLKAFLREYVLQHSKVFNDSEKQLVRIP